MEIHADYPLKDLNTFRVAARADRYIRFHSLDEIISFLAPGNLAIENLLILGGGSNLLFVGDVGGTVLHPELKGIEVLGKDDDHVCVRVMAGEVWDDFVAFAVANGWGGIENLSHIPGSVGASAVQNIGAYGVEVEALIEHVETLTLPEGKPTTIPAADCGFGYRQSHFKTRWPGCHLITAVVFKLRRMPRFNLNYAGVKAHLDQIGPATLANVRQAVIALRRSKLPDPAVLGNAGSFFKNPVVGEAVLKRLLAEHPALPHYPLDRDHYPLGRDHYPQVKARFKLAAGWLIDQCGWKGKSNGDAAVHDQQALVIVNRGHATGAEILALSMEIAISVQERFGVVLEREVRVVGA